ncbi:hypothetical protein BWR17_03475 [Phaeobacter inhibens]|uniref:hypothetical protein n=1 Tax=Phaeobacter inhibens TaxID=221822 RepID=UPI0009719639|nr:hypothetical protein [Phaeobacter inhibens]APX15003.1 hypothetical protein BWR17_03475 [Phaeobacter inhibens]
MISALISRFWGYLVAAGALLAAIWAYLLSRDAEVRKETYIEAKERDHAKADAIRDRVEHANDDQLREFDDRGFRD